MRFRNLNIFNFRLICLLTSKINTAGSGSRLDNFWLTYCLWSRRSCLLFFHWLGSWRLFHWNLLEINVKMEPVLVRRLLVKFLGQSYRWHLHIEHRLLEKLVHVCHILHIWNLRHLNVLIVLRPRSLRNEALWKISSFLESSLLAFQFSCVRN